LGLQKYESIITKITANQPNNLVISKSGIIFYENYNGKKRIMQAGSIDVADSLLSNLTILFINDKNNLLKRIDAKQGVLTDNNLLLTSVTITDNNKSEKYESFVIHTNLSISKLLNNYTNPEMISIWNLPELIQQLGDSGLPVSSYQIYYYKQLFKPIIMSASVMLAACFFSLKQRDNSQTKILIIGLATGLIIYSMAEVILKVLSYNAIPAYLAVLLPNIFILFLSNFVIMHSEGN
jgi:lipopolysaccharide export system permease protein